MNYQNLKIFKIYNCESNVLISLLKKLPLYSDESKLILFDNFIGELYEDFHCMIYDYEFRKFIGYLLKISDKPKEFSLLKLFSKASFDGNFEFIMKRIFIKIEDDSIFFNIIDKYSSIYICEKDIPLDPLANLTVSDKEFNICNLIYRVMVSIDKRIFDTYINSLDRLEKVIGYLSKSNGYFTDIIYNLNSMSYLISENLSEYIKTNISDKTSIDIKKIKTDKEKNFIELYYYVLFKILMEHNKFEDFNDILNKVYCSSQLNLLDMINTSRPELIKLDLIGLKKIIYYGNLEVFEFLFFNIPYVILDLLANSNPLDISDLEDISYKDDIWNGYESRQYINSCKIIGRRKHKELFDLVRKICEEKNYSHVIWSDPVKKHWINLALEYQSESDFQYSNYFISYDKLLKFFKISFDSNNKESIQFHIDIFGKKATWNWIKELDDENFLDLFFV
jgi:hypothetical protein